MRCHTMRTIAGIAPVAAVVALAATACGESAAGVAPRAVSSGSARPVPQAAVRPWTDGLPYAHLEGVLHGDRETGCLWVEFPGGTKQQVVVYGDYRVDFDDAGVVLYRNGEVRGREGQRTGFGGGGRHGGGVEGCPVPASGWVFHGG